MSGGSPGSVICDLGNYSLSGTGYADLGYVAFTSTNCSVINNTQYAIVLSTGSTTQQWAWGSDIAGTYAGGQKLNSGDGVSFSGTAGTDYRLKIFGRPSTDDTPIPSVIIDFSSPTQNPTGITTTNLFGQNLTIYYNISKPNIITNSSTPYLNYTVNTTATSSYLIINGTDSATGYLQQPYTSNSSANFTFSLFADGQIYPANYMTAFINYLNTTHDVISTTLTNNLYKMMLKNITDESQYNIFEIMANVTATTGVANLYFCNSSYSTGSPVLNANCNGFANINGLNTFNHTHTINSAHNLFPFTIINGSVGSVKVSKTSYIIIRAQTGTLNIHSINRTVTVAGSQFSNNNGNTWADTTYTIDYHIHQYDNASFKYQACATNSTNVSCSSFTTQNLSVAALPPSSPEIIYPNNESINITSQFINITWQSSYLTGATNVNYTVSLLNNDTTLNKTLSSVGNSTNLYYDLVNNNITIGYYRIKVLANDTNNLTSFDIGESFHIAYDSLLNITARYYFDNSSISNFNLTVLDLNNSEYRTFLTTGSFINVSTIRNHQYQILIDNAIYAYDIKNITISAPITNYTFYLNRSNSVYFLLFDSVSLQLINTSNSQITLSDGNITYSFVTSNGTYLASNLSSSTYAVVINNSIYAQASFTLTINPDTSQELRAYMIQTNFTQFISFYVKNLATYPLQNATINVQQLINSTYITIGNKQTDVTGFTYFYLEQGKVYKFTVSKETYVTKTFYMEVFTANMPYVIKLDPAITSTFTTIFSEIAYNILPVNSTLYTGSNTYSLQSSSPTGKIQYTYIECNGLSQNVSGFPNGATAQILIVSNYGETVSCKYVIDADGFLPYTAYKNYYIGQQSLINTTTTVKNSMAQFLQSTGKGWTTILAMFIILAIGATLWGLTGNPTVSTFVVFAGIAIFSVMGWINTLIGFFTCAIIALYYFLTARGG